MKRKVKFIHNQAETSKPHEAKNKEVMAFSYVIGIEDYGFNYVWECFKDKFAIAEASYKKQTIFT